MKLGENITVNISFYTGELDILVHIGVDTVKLGGEGFICLVEEGDEVKATTDEDNRVNSDATEMDEALVKAIRSVEVGKAKIVEYGGEGDLEALLSAICGTKITED